MPEQFVKTLGTPNPEVAVNQLPTDNSLQGLAETIVPIVKDLGENRQKEADLESLGNFSSDYNTYQDQLDSLMMEADYARLNSYKKLTSAIRGGEDQQVARQRYAYELDQITLREEQQGISLEAQKRALVRKWTAIRPDLATEFQKALTINKTLQDLDQVTSRTDERFAKARALEAEAAKLGVTVEYIMDVEASTLDKTAITNKFEMMATRGKIDAPAFDQMVQADWKEQLAMIPIKLAQANAAIMRDPSAALKAKEWINGVGATTLEMIRAKRLAWEAKAAQSGKPVILDTSNLEAEIRSTIAFYASSLGTTGDTYNNAAIQKMAQDRNAGRGVNALVTAMTNRDFSYYDPSGKVALAYLNNITRAMDSYGYDRLLKDLSKPSGLSNLSQRLQVGDSNAKTIVSFLPLYMPNFRSILMDPNYKFTPQQQAVVLDVFAMMSRGQNPSSTMVSQAGPVIATLANELLGQPDLPEDARKNLEATSGAASLMSFGSVFRGYDVLNPSSNSAIRSRDLPQPEWKALFETNVESQLESKEAAVESVNKAAIVYDPSDTITPFKIQHRLTGDARATSELVKEMNDVYMAIVNTRHNGQKLADEWARQYMDTRITGNAYPLPQEDTSNTGPPTTVISDEDFARVMQGVATSTAPLQRSVNSGN